MVRKAVVLVMAGLMAGSALAWANSTTTRAQASLTIPALTRLSLAGTSDGGREISVSVEVPTAAAHASGFVELKGAAVFVVRSNVPWTLVVRPADRLLQGVVEVRAGRGEYRPVRPEGLVLARGTPGVHEILLDYRVGLDGGAGWSGGRTLALVYAVEG